MNFATRSRQLLQQVLALAQTRLEMLGLALEQERIGLARELKLAAICIVCAWLAGTTLVLWVMVALPQVARVWLLGVLFALFAITALVSYMTLKRAAQRERLFTRLAAQLQLDRISLGDSLDSRPAAEPGKTGPEP